MRPPTRSNDTNDEESPLLRVQNDDAPQKPTPLPITQISIVVLLWVGDGMMFTSIGTYINQLVGDLPIVGGDARKVGYYTGIIISLHYTASAVTSFHWNRLSDHIGRKPILLASVASAAISVILFGLSRSFGAILFSRCLHGALKGTGVMKCMMAELTDETNGARGVSFSLLAWSFGAIIGPLIGGTLSRPQDRWPYLFSHSFWAEYPYFLPCLVVATFYCVAFVIMALFLKETLIRTSPTATINSDVHQESMDVRNAPSKDMKKPSPLTALLTRSVLVTMANYGMFSLLEMSALTLIPLIWSTPVEFGGLNFSPASIGLWLSVSGCMDGIFQFAICPRVIGRFGMRRVFVSSIAMAAVIFVMFPLENLVIRHTTGGPGAMTGLLILLHFLSLSIHEMGTSVMFMYISSATPNRRSLGALNGLAQGVASVQYTVGPIAAGSLFAFSVTNNILGGNFVYVVLFTLVGVGLYFTAKLPKGAWRHGGR